jgi:hypothetical protein
MCHGFLLCKFWIFQFLCAPSRCNDRPGVNALRRFTLVFASALVLILPSPAWTNTPAPKYLLFHIFNGAVEADGVFKQTASAPQLMSLAQQISTMFRPAGQVASRQLGFDWGPISPDMGGQQASLSIQQAFAVALATNTAVAIHLDDRMFWKSATLPDGSLLLAKPGTTEWTNWNGDPAPPLLLPWEPNTNLAPQMCYENATVQAWTQYWVFGTIGPAIMAGYRRLLKAGKPQLFAGVFAGWESNLDYGYCSLSFLGYGASNPPTDFAAAQATVIQRHASLWAQYLRQAGIPANLIYTHLALNQVPSWVALNPYSNSGWTNYVNSPGFTGVYDAVGQTPWAQAEGSNVVLASNCTDDACPSPYPWESYLAASYNHGALVVNIYGAFEGAAGAFTSAVGAQAIAAYRKFLTGQTLIESQPFP